MSLLRSWRERRATHPGQESVSTDRLFKFLTTGPMEVDTASHVESIVDWMDPNQDAQCFHDWIMGAAIGWVSEPATRDHWKRFPGIKLNEIDWHALSDKLRHHFGWPLLRAQPEQKPEGDQGGEKKSASANCGKSAGWHRAGRCSDPHCAENVAARERRAYWRQHPEDRKEEFKRLEDESRDIEGTVREMREEDEGMIEKTSAAESGKCQCRGLYCRHLSADEGDGCNNPQSGGSFCDSCARIIKFKEGYETQRVEHERCSNCLEHFPAAQMAGGTCRSCRPAFVNQDSVECAGCGRSDLPLHTDGRCPGCSKNAPIDDAPQTPSDVPGMSGAQRETAINKLLDRWRSEPEARSQIEQQLKSLRAVRALFQVRRAEKDQLWAPDPEIVKNTWRRFQCTVCGNVQAETTNHLGAIMSYCKKCSWAPSKGECYNPMGDGRCYRKFTYMGEIDERHQDQSGFWDSGSEAWSRRGDAQDPKKKERVVQKRSPSEVLALAGFNDPQMLIGDLWTAFTKSGARERHDHAITSVHLTGSRWKGDDHEGSDLDVVVYHNGNAMISEANQAFRAKVAEITGGVVDAFLLPQSEAWDHPMSGNIMGLTASSTSNFFRAGERQRLATYEWTLASDLTAWDNRAPVDQRDTVPPVVLSAGYKFKVTSKSRLDHSGNPQLVEIMYWHPKGDPASEGGGFALAKANDILRSLSAADRGRFEAEHPVQAPDSASQVPEMTQVQRQQKIDGLLDRWNKEPEKRQQIEQQLKSLRAFSALFSLRIASKKNTGGERQSLFSSWNRRRAQGTDWALVEKLMKQHWDSRVAEDWAGGLDCTGDSEALNDLLHEAGMPAEHVASYYRDANGNLWSHDWLELDGKVLDVTHSQFGAPDYLIANVGDPRYPSMDSLSDEEQAGANPSGAQPTASIREKWRARRAEGADPAAGPFNAPWPDQIQAFMQAVYDQTAGHPFTRGQRVWNGSVIVEVHPWRGGPDPEYPWIITLKWLQSMEPGKGNARECLAWLTALADEYGVPIDLHAKPTGEPKIPKPALKNLYKDTGFERDRGQGPDDMVRHPKLSAAWRARRAEKNPDGSVNWETVEAIAEQARAIMIETNPDADYRPLSMCGVANEALAQELIKLGHKVDEVRGVFLMEMPGYGGGYDEVGPESFEAEHSWLEVDGQIVDISADQFNEYLHGGAYPPVFIGTNDGRFVEQSRRPATLWKMDDLQGGIAGRWRARRAAAETQVGTIDYRGQSVPVMVPTQDLAQWLKLRTDDRIVHDPALGKQFTDLVARIYDYAASKIEPNANIRESQNISLYPDIERCLDYYGYGNDEIAQGIQPPTEQMDARLREAAFAMFEQHRIDLMGAQQAADLLMNMAMVLHKDLGMTLDEAKAKLSTLLMEFGGTDPGDVKMNSLRGRWTQRRAGNDEQKLLRELICTVIGSDSGTTNEAVLPAGAVVGVQPWSNDHTIFFYSPIYSKIIVRGKVMKSNQYSAPVQDFRAATDIGYGDGTGYKHGPECFCEECMANDDMSTHRCPTCGSRECPGDGHSIDCRKPGTMTIKDVPTETKDSLLDKFNRGEIDEATLRRRMKQISSSLSARWRERRAAMKDMTLTADLRCVALAEDSGTQHSAILLAGTPITVTSEAHGVTWFFSSKYSRVIIEGKVLQVNQYAAATLELRDATGGQNPPPPGQRQSLLSLWFSRIANDPLKKIIEINGVKIGIEWPKGSTRTWKHLPGNDYEKLMKADYGYIRQTEGEDGEEIDVYAGPDKDSDLAFVVTQLDKKTGEYDEDKIMLGYGSEAEAKASYLEHMEKAHFGGIKKMSWPEFLKLVPKSQRVKDAVEKKAAGGPGGQAAVLTDDLRVWPQMGDNRDSLVLPKGTRVVIKRHFEMERVSGGVLEIEYQRTTGVEAGYWRRVYCRAGDASYTGLHGKPVPAPALRRSEPSIERQIESGILELMKSGAHDLTDADVRDQIIRSVGLDPSPTTTSAYEMVMNSLLKSEIVSWDPNSFEFWTKNDFPDRGRVDNVPGMAPNDVQTKIDALLDQLAVEQDPKKKQQIEQRIRSLSATTKDIWRRRAGDTMSIDEQRSPGAISECDHGWPGKKPGERGWCGRCRL